MNWNLPDNAQVSCPGSSNPAHLLRRLGQRCCTPCHLWVGGHCKDRARQGLRDRPLATAYCCCAITRLSPKGQECPSHWQGTAEARPSLLCSLPRVALSCVTQAPEAVEGHSVLDFGCWTPTLHTWSPQSLQWANGATHPATATSCRSQVCGLQSSDLLQGPQLSPRMLCDPRVATGPL